jgi:hypothetical protein
MQVYKNVTSVWIEQIFLKVLYKLELHRTERIILVAFFKSDA